MNRERSKPSKYLVIKLTGGWIHNEQIIQRIRLFCEDIPFAEVLEGAVAECHSAERVSKEQLYAVNDRQQYEDFVKTNIAVELGDFLKGQGFITFERREDKFDTDIIGTIYVIREGEQ